ncbi:universal stress protein [Microlunatus ginsengisoli]|uniref:Universal stress protein n=1 Tax=Microlunatus ginsengisoli TaxID=363863 RepID=A0ABP7AV49_9ACTN
MTDHLVVGIDGSDESAVALRWAVDQARRRGCSVKLVYALLIPVVSDAYGMVMTRPDVDELAAYSKGLLGAAAEVVHRLDPDIAVETTLREGPPAAVLLDESRSALGLVVGTRGLGAISGKLLGSVSVRVAVKAACPVYVIPPEWNPVACAGDPVVVGVDGSDHSEAALRLAIEECRLCDSPLKAVIAYHVGRFSKPIEPELIAQYDASEKAMARRTVERSLERAGLTGDGAPRVEIHVVEGKPADALVEAGRNALITVLGSRGRGGIARALLGSVSRSVMQETARPLAVVHAKRDADHG